MKSNSWELEKWWQKTVYVIGWITVVWWIMCFFAGFLIGLAEAIK